MPPFQVSESCLILCSGRNGLPTISRRRAAWAAGGRAAQRGVPLVRWSSTNLAGVSLVASRGQREAPHRALQSPDLGMLRDIQTASCASAALWNAPCRSHSIASPSAYLSIVSTARLLRFSPKSGQTDEWRQQATAHSRSLRSLAKYA